MILTGIGLGPGDPELITLKAMKALKEADVVFYPASSVKEDKVQSFSFKILEQLEIEAPCQPLEIPMTGKNRQQRYREAFQEVKAEVENGKKVVVVNEGDVLFYSTFGYLFKLAREEDIPCHVIPGIPAFIAAGATGEQPLVEGNSAFNLIARPQSFEQIDESLQAQPGATLTVMKMKVLDGWYDFLKKSERSFLYVEKAGTSDEFVTSDVEDLNDREIPYFSVIIIYGNG